MENNNTLHDDDDEKYSPDEQQSSQSQALHCGSTQLCDRSHAQLSSEEKSKSFVFVQILCQVVIKFGDNDDEVGSYK